MDDEQKLLVGAWLDAIGTIIAAVAEVRELSGIEENNNQLISIGEALQAVGTLLIGTVTTDDPLNFAGNWINGAGAAASSIGAYLQDLDPENGEENVRLETIGDAFQSMGAAISSLADHLAGEQDYALASAIESLGAGLEAIGGVYELRGKETEGQPIATIGAIIQAIGSNMNAILVSRDYLAES